jgi:hypothetical protein
VSGRKSPSQIAAERARDASIEKANREDMAALMKRPEFRRLVRRYLDLTSVFRTTFTGTSETFFKEGQRSVGTTLFGEVMEAAAELYLQMMREPTNADRFPPAVEDDD